jgi:hypothetical protein
MSLSVITIETPHFDVSIANYTGELDFVLLEDTALCQPSTGPATRRLLTAANNPPRWHTGYQ